MPHPIYRYRLDQGWSATEAQPQQPSKLWRLAYCFHTPSTGRITYIWELQGEEENPPNRAREAADAYREGWENGWDAYRHKAQTHASMSVTFSADEFDPDWDSSRTKHELKGE